MITTKRGYRLAGQLGRFVGFTDTIERLTTILARDARAYSTIQERWCNEEMSDALTAKLERRETALETKIRDNVDRLPAPDDGPWRVEFEGDPRGSTVQLIAPNGYVIAMDEN